MSRDRLVSWWKRVMSRAASSTRTELALSSSSLWSLACVCGCASSLSSLSSPLASNDVTLRDVKCRLYSEPNFYTPLFKKLREKRRRRRRTYYCNTRWQQCTTYSIFNTECSSAQIAFFTVDLALP